MTAWHVAYALVGVFVARRIMREFLPIGDYRLFFDDLIVACIAGLAAGIGWPLVVFAYLISRKPPEWWARIIAGRSPSAAAERDRRIAELEEELSL